MQEMSENEAELFDFRQIASFRRTFSENAILSCSVPHLGNI